MSEQLENRCFVFLLHGLYLATENIETDTQHCKGVSRGPVETKKNDLETFSQAALEESCKLDVSKASKHMLFTHKDIRTQAKYSQIPTNSWKMHGNESRSAMRRCIMLQLCSKDWHKRTAICLNFLLKSCKWPHLLVS